jgi:DNA mismatch repair protein MutL
MEREDALLCFERHATSKITTEDELFHISTLGFRGEALPSIASVSKVTLTTAQAYSDVGVKIDIGANQKKEIAEAPPVKGTAVEIRDIFYNTPARRKFLKTVPTELSHIAISYNRNSNSKGICISDHSFYPYP